MSETRTEPSAQATPQPVDGSLTVSGYSQIGMPNPDRFWLAKDYADGCEIIHTLDRQNRAALPRLDSTRSGPVFARLINETNTLRCLEATIPSSERIRLYQSLLIFIPSILDVYKLSGNDATFHRETVELAHLHLHLLRRAIELDGQSVTPLLAETKPAVIHLSEATLTPWNAPYTYEQSRVPRGERFSVLGAHAAVTFGLLLPWLADRTVIPDPERVAATVYLNEDMPGIWSHIMPSTRESLLATLDSTIEATHQTEVRQGLEKLRNRLNLASRR